MRTKNTLLAPESDLWGPSPYYTVNLLKIVRHKKY
jgi:hypothetical protein